MRARAAVVSGSLRAPRARAAPLLGIACRVSLGVAQGPLEGRAAREGRSWPGAPSERPRRMGCCFSSSEAAREADAAGYAERRERMLAAAEEREAAQFKGISAKVETIARHSQGGRRVPSGGVGRALRRGWDVCFGVLLRAQERRGQTAPRVCKRAREAAQQK